jgi:hypothetical protein
MLEKLTDIWILSNDGLVIFNRVADERIDAQLFGGFMSAINAFAKELDDSGISGFELGKKRYIIRKENKLLFIANYKKEVKQKGAEQELDEIVKEFYHLYTKEFLTSWNGDVSKFDTFSQEFDKKQKQVVDKLKDSLWI